MRHLAQASDVQLHIGESILRSIHYDVEYCRRSGMPDLLAHDFQTLVHTAPGAGLFPYLVEESLVGFLEQ